MERKAKAKVIYEETRFFDQPKCYDEQKAKIKVVKITDAVYDAHAEYIIIEKTIRCGNWEGAGSFDERAYFKSASEMDLSSKLEIRGGESADGFIDSDIIRIAVKEADKWFNECMERLIGPDPEDEDLDPVPVDLPDRIIQSSIHGEITVNAIG
jgi:hypothetical protein